MKHVYLSEAENRYKKEEIKKQIAKLPKEMCFESLQSTINSCLWKDVIQIGVTVKTNKLREEGQ